MKETFRRYLLKSNLSSNTVRLYVRAVCNYFQLYPEITKSSLLNYKEHCVVHYKPSTANCHINALNKYLEFSKQNNLKLKLVRVQHKYFLENVISNEDYLYFKNRLQKDGNHKLYFVIWCLAATGARISELLQIKVEHLRVGHIDLLTKGGKVRRIYIPQKLCDEFLSWLESQHVETGFAFFNKSGSRISRVGIVTAMKRYAKKYKIDEAVVYPHSFRHRFAKNFLEKYNDIALLADLMGHESIETTRIYLRMTAGEQNKIINDVVTW